MNHGNVNDVSRRTELPVKVCSDLLNAGWTYVETATGYKWEKPKL